MFINTSYQITVASFSCKMSDKRPEQSIASARASVMVYDDVNKKWVASGSSHGLSKVSNRLYNSKPIKTHNSYARSVLYVVYAMPSVIFSVFGP